MRAFVIFALIAVVAARPDIGLQLQGQGGYAYGSSSGGSDGGYSSGGNALRLTDVGGGGNNVVGSLFQGISSYDAPLVSGNSFGGGAGGAADGGVSQGQTQVIDISGGAAAGGVIYKPVIKQGPPQITKHFYVHEAPEEPSNVRVEEKEINVRPQKHYKIIFIKAPSGGQSFGGSNAAVFPQNEEKTIVYVLSKKPEGISDNGEFPQPPPAVTSKPEVFFVKYKTQQEAEGAISQIQESFKEGGAGYNSPASFAQSLGASSGSASSSSFSQGRSDGFAGPKPGSAQSFVESASAGFGGSSGGSVQQTMIELPQGESAFRTEYLNGQ